MALKRLMALIFSPHGFDALAEELKKALGSEEGIIAYMPNFIKDANRKLRALFKESLFVNAPLSTAIRKHFPDHLNVSDIENLGMVISNITEGCKIIASSGGEYEKVSLHDAFLESMAFPFAFQLIYRRGMVRGDGGLHAPPLKEAFEMGADIVYLTLLNYFIPRNDDAKARGPRGIYNRAHRMFEIMQRDAADTSITQLTGRESTYVAEEGDPNGRILLSLDDLSDYDPFRQESKHSELKGRGTATTTKVLAHLDPKRSHPEYDPKRFIEEIALGKKFGDRYRVVIIEAGNGHHLNI